MENYEILIYGLFFYVIYLLLTSSGDIPRILIGIVLSLHLYYNGIKTKWNIFDPKPRSEREYIIRPLKEYFN